MDASKLLIYINNYLISLSTAHHPYGFRIIEESRVSDTYSEFEIMLIRDSDNEVIAKHTVRFGKLELLKLQVNAEEHIEKEKEMYREKFIKDLLLRGAVKTEEIFDEGPRMLKDGELVLAED